MAEPPSDDPNTRLWVHALRAQIDALVLQFEVQLRQHVAATAGVHAHEITRLRAEAAARDHEITRLRAEAAALVTARDASAATVSRLEAQLRDLGEQVQTLDEQFATEKRWVAAVLPAAGTALFDAAQQALGIPVEATPVCYGALKARKADAALAQTVRERGRTATRSPLADTERGALRAMADASGCELVEPAVGARFTTGSMEKVGTRSEPSEEDMVLECVMPGLRLAGSPGSLVHPRVIVGTA